MDKTVKKKKKKRKKGSCFTVHIFMPRNRGSAGGLLTSSEERFAWTALGQSCALSTSLLLHAESAGLRAARLFLAPICTVRTPVDQKRAPDQTPNSRLLCTDIALRLYTHSLFTRFRSFSHWYLNAF